MKNIQEVIVRPLITERSTLLKENGKYSFEVHSNATKREIKNAVEHIFKKEKVEVAGCPLYSLCDCVIRCALCLCKSVEVVK